ncbi:MAG TPA: ABC transporter permease [Phycisphaerae bacterium]|nr:ABC transporter permease [Phycisphaerae bacterium]HOJ73752.1 ABC transporter permease [Phycisphaerae bacterium]HOM50399.1 ABC transporter permease [Phycisphaerae bacterium]HON65685.1 ABC transporter permease [Phycisphaerae bacterium]HOQ84189.1 ABC transporter permease [Phycisphaerae bacterium]
MFTGLALETVRLGLKNIYLHKLRSFLTALGIICGVGAVICMLSIGEGASEAEMALIRLLGTQNVIIQSVRPEGAKDVSEARSNLLEYGLTTKDLELISNTIPSIVRVVPLREVAFEVNYGAIRLPTKVVATPPTFFETIHIEVARGRPLEPIDQANAAKVCVIGDDVRQRLFAYKDPIGECIMVSSEASGLIPFEIVGVLRRVQTAGSPSKGIGERNINSEVFIPLSTGDARYSDLQIKRSSGSREFSRCMYSDFYVQVESLDYVLPVSEMLARALQVRHDRADYAIHVPRERLRIAEAEKRNRQVTLGCIAGISLLVGGIGIMNIMLATVTERTREIGIRRALGAKRRHITVQFLIEAMVLTTVGGIIGIIAGSLGAHLITSWVGWPTVIHQWTILVSFGLAVAVGVFFGIYPASAAARLDPIEALRHE